MPLYRESNLTMPTEDDLKLLLQVLAARSIPDAPASFDNDDMSTLFNDLVAIRNVLMHFSRGNFDADLTGRNVFIATLKTLQANLRHLTWQVGEVANGVFTHRVDFMGEFSDAFNSMVQQLERSLTDLKEREADLLSLTEELKASEERWSFAVQCSRDGIWDINIDERTAWYSDRFMQMMGYTPDDLPQHLDWATNIHPEDRSHVKTISKMLQGKSTLSPFSIECRLRTRRQEYIWVSLRGMPVHTGNVRRLIVVVSDISYQKETEKSLKQQAMYDSLTELPNRYLLDDRLKQFVANVERNGKPFIFIMLDLDFFKEVNDTYGHAVGDHVLVEFARRLRKDLRDTDTVARLGGDEFVAVYPCEIDREQETAETVMNRFYDHLKPPLTLGDTEYVIHSSAGVAFFPKHASDLPALFERADTALYKAKKNDKNQYVVYDPTEDYPSSDSAVR